MTRSASRVAAIAVVVLLVVVVGCTSGGEDTSETPSATAAPEVTSTRTVVATATPLPLPTASPAPSASATAEATRTPPPPSTVWLVDARTGDVLTLHQDGSPGSARFDSSGEQVQLRTGGDLVTFALDGSRLPTQPTLECEQGDGVAVVGGSEQEGVRCGLIAPNGRWMLYEIPIEGANGNWDQWVLDLESGERRLLQEGMRHCGGCDGRFGPAFSPDGDQVYFAELIQDGRVYAVDLVDGDVEIVSEGSTESGRRPIWAADAARLLHSDDGERVRLKDFATDTTVEVTALVWPATFGAGGLTLYSPTTLLRDSPPITKVVDATTLEVVAQVSGVAGSAAVWYPRKVVALGEGGVVVAVEQGETCPTGTTVYTTVVQDGECFESAVGATVAPNGSRVAFARLTEDVTPSFRFASDFEVVIVDPLTMESQTLPVVAQSYDAPPFISWNAGGTHFLVTWPWGLGL